MAEKTRIEELERLLRESEIQRQVDRQRVELAEQRRLEERKRAEREQQRAEREQQRAEREQQRAERERQRAEEAERGREESEEQTRLTTLDEYIAACHASVFSRLTIETNPKLTSKGSITNPRDKWCPTTMQPWSDFIEQQRVAFGTLYDTFPSERRVFENKNFLHGLGNRVSKRPVANEKSLEYFLHHSVEDPVRNIIEELKEVPEVCSAFGLGNGIIFENHPHAISDTAEEVVDAEDGETPVAPPQTPVQPRDLQQLRADQICIYRSDNAHSSRRTMIYISEYKPPHKLTALHLRVGLRPLNIYKDVVNRKTIPTSVDPDARFQYFAERLTASAITQTYHYMIEGGLEYSLLTTGEAIVFLKINWSDPGTLYYHLAEPSPEVSAHPNHFHLCTAVGQYLAFTLVVLGAPGERRGHGQAERQRAQQNLKTWATDFETTLRTIPENERMTSPEGSLAPKPTTYEHFDRSPIILRWGRKTRGKCKDNVPTRKSPSEESSDDESSAKPPETPTPAGRTRRSQRIQARKALDGGVGGGAGAADTEAEAKAKTSPVTADQEDRPYCTQKCLLGIIRGQQLDDACPNSGLHRKGGNRLQTHHPVSHRQWLNMLEKQLKQSLDDGIEPLGLGGSRGVLFKVTLLAYGYTFISKGTIRVFIKHLEHEAAVYKHLRPIQGVHVPVFLGAIDLRPMNKIYYYDHRVYVVYMTFLSWGGYSTAEAEKHSSTKQSLEQEASLSLQAVHRLGVLHKDVRPANMLVNSETGGVMMIDFERAELPKRPRQALAQLVPNKRAWEKERMDEKLVDDSSKGKQGFGNEVWELKAIFL